MKVLAKVRHNFITQKPFEKQWKLIFNCNTFFSDYRSGISELKGFMSEVDIINKEKVPELATA